MTPNSGTLRESYQRLGLAPGASLEEIKKAYRGLAKNLHPDRNQGRGGDFMAHLNRAYETLLNHVSSQTGEPYRFQEFGAAGPMAAEPAGPTDSPRPKPGWKAGLFQPGPTPAAGPLNPPAAGADSRPGPIGPAQAAPNLRLVGLGQKGDGLVYRLELAGSPQKAVLPLRSVESCAQCGGAGFRLLSSGGGLCPACGGRGKITRSSSLAVKLPASWRDGQLLRARTPAGETIYLELNRMSAQGRA